mmetsp:Transcript_6876/g.20566  ORF Transcript_6876/g.20566 Transcript_6876/m.20566 type:complete len:205 (+) Transcript_6876:604-1218(+)
MNTRTSLIFLVHRIQANEVLLRMRGHLRGRSRNNKVSRNRSPIAFPKLGQPEEKQTVFFFRPRNTFSPLLLLRELLLGTTRAGSHVRPRGSSRFRRAAAVRRLLLLHAVSAAILLVLRQLTRWRSGHFKLHVVIQTPIRAARFARRLSKLRVLKLSSPPRSRHIFATPSDVVVRHSRPTALNRANIIHQLIVPLPDTVRRLCHL